MKNILTVVLTLATIAASAGYTIYQMVFEAGKTTISSAPIVMPHLIKPSDVLKDKAPKKQEEAVEQKKPDSPVPNAGKAVTPVTERRDPFIALIVPKTVKVESEKKKAGSVLEGFEPAELRLVAVLWDVSGSYAVLTLPDGKSYTVHEGMKLGSSGGEVYKITKDSVIIREMYKDKRGILRSKDTPLKLRVEVEEDR
jgi:Tfp pilus assembly protein PilP